MKNTIKYYIVSFITAIVLFGGVFGGLFENIFGSLFADSSTEVSTEYYITSYDVNIEVGEDNILAITETIDVHFTNLNKHGIVRALPLKQTVYYVKDDGKIISKRYGISYGNLSSDTDAQTDSDSNYLYVYLGNEYAYVSSNEQYVIYYEANLGDDRIAEFDQFYYNVLGDNWDTSVSDFSCTITFPKDVGTNTGKVYAGAIGEDTLGTDVNIVENVITYSHASTIEAYNAITIKVVLLVVILFQNLEYGKTFWL
jgi:hypothetical protein